MQPGAAFRERGSRHPRQPAVHHYRPPHLRQRDFRCLRDGLEHHAFQRPLAQFPHEQVYKELLLIGDSACKQRSKRLFAGGDRASSASVRDLFQGLINVAYGQRW
jgi:hypothetical protein